VSAIGRATGREAYRVAVALGSGLSDVAGALVEGDPIPYTAIEGMPVSAVEGHEGSLYHGDIDGVPSLVFAGRVHLYEGHDAHVVTHWVRAAVEAGCDTIVLTNAAGGLRLELEVGAPCLISDHINLTGANPLLGPNDDSVGPRFLDQSEVYDAELRVRAKEIDGDLAEGVYAGLLGPTYETPAEVRMLATVGADLVGMSTVLEAIQARYLGARVLGISVVTNRAAGLGPPLSHEEVGAAGRKAAERLERILRGVIRSL
jgi:purine-nucleoside phosphorylase